MPFRVMDLIDMPELGTRFLSGEQGQEKIVRWAHVCELADPSEWLGEGDLLMTTGIGIPTDADAQKHYILSLSKAGLAGVTIGENMQAPENIDALKQQAADSGFPLMMTDYDVPFATVTRAVIDANRKEEFERRNSITRVYVSARMAIEGLNLQELLQRLEKDIQATLILVDPIRLTPYLSRSAPLTPDLYRVLQRQLPDSLDRQSMVRRYVVENGEVLSVALPTQHRCVLLVRREQNHWLDYSLLQHVAAVLSIAMERMHVDSERALRMGSELLDDLLQQRLSPLQVGKRLERFAIPLKSARLGIVRSTKLSLSECHLQNEQLGIACLMRPQGDEVVLLIADSDTAALQKILGERLGLSSLVEDPERFPELLREARLAWTHSSVEQPIIVYAQIADKLPWLVQSLDEANQTFRQVLGALHDYDQEQGATLLTTLRVFLEQNRSWKTAAEALHIHKTTLIYRVKRIESITGRSLYRTEDVAVLWLALQAKEVIG